MMAGLAAPPKGPATGAYAFSAGLLLLGAVCVARPRLGAQIFGLPAGPTALPYVRALAFRDFATAGALTLMASGRATSPFRGLALSLAVIPAGDIAVVGAHGRRSAWPSLILHGLSALALIGLAAAGGRPAGATRPSEIRNGA